MKTLLIVRGVIFLGTLLPIPALAQGGLDLFDEADFESSLDDVAPQEKEQPETTSSPQPASPPVQESTPTDLFSGLPPIAAPKASPQPTNLVSPTPPPAALSPQASSSPAVGRQADGTEQTRPRLLPQLGSKAGKPEEDKDDEVNVSIFERRRRQSGATETDVSKFDIAGIVLKMTPFAVEQVARMNGFSLKFKNYKVPTFLRWRYKEACLKKKVYPYDDLQKCIDSTADQERKRYVEKLVFEKKDNHEKITVNFTSTFVDNIAFRIRYDSYGNPGWGSTKEGEYLKMKRRQDFFRDIFQKYGTPDDEEFLVWGAGDVNSASLIADITATFLDASLVLEDLSLTDDDAEAMQIDDTARKALNDFNF